MTKVLNMGFSCKDYLYPASVIGQGFQKKQAVVLLLGPPRSGSTLITQVLADAFNVGYLSNLHCRWAGAPDILERVVRPLSHRETSNYESIHGRTKLNTDPAECGAWWYRFFRREPPYVTLDDVSEWKMTAFRRSLSKLGSAFGLPLIFKNLYATLRIEPIAHHVPNALFVVIERDWVDNGHSILKGRCDALGDYAQWWSVPPPNVDELSELEPVQQEIGQIQSIQELINRDIQRLGLEDRTFRIRYEDFCEDVHGTLNAFQTFMARNGVQLERRFDVPAQFTVSRSVKIPQPMYEELLVEVGNRKGRTRVDRELGR